jgi:hypothetical protein
MVFRILILISALVVQTSLYADDIPGQGAGGGGGGGSGGGEAYVSTPQTPQEVQAYKDGKKVGSQVRQALKTEGVDAASTGGKAAKVTNAPSKSSLESRTAANEIGAEAAMNSAQVEALYQDGKINKATRDEILAQMALQELAAFNSVPQSPGKSNSNSGSSERGTAIEPARSEPASITTGGFDPNTGTAETISIPLPSTPTPSPRTPSSGEVTNLGSEDHSYSHEEIDRAPQSVGSVVVMNPDGSISAIGGKESAATFSGVGVAVPMESEFGQASRKLTSVDGTYNPPAPGAGVVAADDKLDASTAVLLARALAKKKGQADTKTEEKKDEKKSLAASAGQSFGAASASPSATAEQIAYNSSLDLKLDELLDATIAKASKASSDLGRWFMEATGRRKPASTTTDLVAGSNQITLDGEAAAWGGSLLALLFAGLIGSAAWFYKRAHKAEKIGREQLFHDSKTQDYQIAFKKIAGKRRAVLEVMDRSTKAVVDHKELVDGSILFARYLPPHLIGKMDLTNGLEHVKYTGNWNFEKTDDDVKIMVHAYRNGSPAKKAS